MSLVPGDIGIVLHRVVRWCSSHLVGWRGSCVGGEVGTEGYNWEAFVTIQRIADVHMYRIVMRNHRVNKLLVEVNGSQRAVS